MDISYLRTVRKYPDIVHGTIPYNGFESLILHTPLLLRLQRISQNSLVFLTFPSNKTKRFEHSIGVMHIASKMLRAALINTNAKTLDSMFEEIKNEIDDMLKEATKDIRYSGYCRKCFGMNGDYILSNATNLKRNELAENAFFKMLIPNNIEDKYYTLCAFLFQGVRLAGLLHDIGHLPYSHTLEAILKDIYKDLEHKDNKMALETKYIELSKPFFENGQALHEELSRVMVSVVEQEIAQKITQLGTASQENESKVYSLMSIVAFLIAESILYKKDTCIYRSFHNIISGIVDADRLDYVSRDLLCSAVSSDIINYDRLFIHASIQSYTDDKNLTCYSVVFDIKSIRDIEEFLRRRLRIYTDINYHHSVHKSELTMQRLLRKKAIDTLSTDIKDIAITMQLPELEQMTSFDDIVKKYDTKLPDDFILGILIILVHLQNDGNPECLITLILSLDDSWLDTVLKRTVKPTPDDEELIFGRSAYKTIIKRYDDYLVVDEQIFLHYKSKKDYFCALFATVATINDKKAFMFNIDFFEDLFCSVFKEYEEYIDFVSEQRKFFSTLIIDAFNSIDATTNHLEMFARTLSPADNPTPEIFIGGNSIKAGTEGEQPYKLWSPKKRKAVDFSHYSFVHFDFEDELSTYPLFHLYAKNGTNEEICIKMVTENFIEYTQNILEKYLQKPQ
jgi:HD superfamily phosphohydrolase